jgi:3-hydroxyisobutyrate dehydrogenase-like beta-hydroxyacid dehydrogenase
MIGVVGIGRMGAPILRHLSSTFRAAGHDADDDRAVLVSGAGAEWYSDVADLAAVIDVLVTVLPGPAEMRAVAETALPLMRPGSLWIDLTSSDPRVTAELAAVASRHTIAVVAAPMGGSVPNAEEASLSFFVSGEPAAVERALPVLEVLSSRGGKIRQVGARAQDGQVVKLLANALWFANALAASEALLAGQAAGLDPEHLHDLLRDSAGGSVFMSEYLPRLLDGDYLETFGVDRVVEELTTVAEVSRDAGAVTPVLDASAEVHRAALQRFGPVPGELLGVRLLEEQSGRELRRRPRNAS